MQAINHTARPLALGIILATALLGGCAVYYPDGYYEGTGVIATAPPPPRVEIIGVAPWPGAVWITGRWIWSNRWVWHDGYWAKPPHPHSRWSPGRWEHRDSRQWFWIQGHWH